MAEGNRKSSSLLSCVCFACLPTVQDQEEIRKGTVNKVGLNPKNKKKTSRPVLTPGGVLKTAERDIHSSSEDSITIPAVSNTSRLFSRPSSSAPHSPSAAPPLSSHSHISRHATTSLRTAQSSRPQLIKESWDVLVTVQTPLREEETETEDVHAIRNHDNQEQAESSSFRANGPYISVSSAELPPLPSSQSLLEEIGQNIAVNDQQHITAALVLLQRGIKHRRNHFIHCLGELLAVITACLESKDPHVALAALHAASDMVTTYGDLLLQYFYNQDQNLPSFLIQMLYLAGSGKAPQNIKSAAETLLRKMAATLHQQSMVKLLERAIADPHNTKYIKSKASTMLVITTYRLS